MFGEADFCINYWWELVLILLLLTILDHALVKYFCTDLPTQRVKQYLNNSPLSRTVRNNWKPIIMSLRYWGVEKTSGKGTDYRRCKVKRVERSEFIIPWCKLWTLSPLRNQWARSQGTGFAEHQADKALQHANTNGAACEANCYYIIFNLSAVQ